VPSPISNGKGFGMTSAFSGFPAFTDRAGPHWKECAKARRTASICPDQIFSRVHVEDIVSGLLASFAAPAGVYNLADDFPCSQNAVIEFASQLMGSAPPPMQIASKQAQLSPMAAAFYAENRRISNRKAKRLLGWNPQYQDYKQGLTALFHNFGEKVD
jgi:nucleoside-diphosphate-sugar epimerase